MNVEEPWNDDILSNKQTCRICLEDHVHLYSLFRKRSDGLAPYDKIINYANIKLDLIDTGPTCICSQCVTELDITVKFLEKCEQANRFFISFAENNYIEDQQLTYQPEPFTQTQTYGYSLEEKEYEEELTEEKLLEKAIRDAEDIAEEEKVKKLVSRDKLNCPQCGSQKRCKHWRPPTQYICDHCHKCFNRKYNYLLHLKRHTGQKEFPCPTCGVYFITQSAADRHCLPRPRHACAFAGCYKSFTTTTNLRTHMRMHNGERPLQCPVCNKQFACRNTLNDHKRIHTGERPYMCVVCGKSFTTNKLSSHMRVHSGSRPHPCPHPGCSRTFPSPRALASHRRTHLAARTHYACAACPARYNHSQSLNKHIRKHHSQMPRSVLNDNNQNYNTNLF